MDMEFAKAFDERMAITIQRYLGIAAVMPSTVILIEEAIIAAHLRSANRARMEEHIKKGKSR
jgi:hypothetical protein